MRIASIILGVVILPLASFSLERKMGQEISDILSSHPEVVPGPETCSETKPKAVSYPVCNRYFPYTPGEGVSVEECLKKRFWAGNGNCVCSTIEALAKCFKVPFPDDVSLLLPTAGATAGEIGRSMLRRYRAGEFKDGKNLPNGWSIFPHKEGMKGGVTYYSCKGSPGHVAIVYNDHRQESKPWRGDDGSPNSFLTSEGKQCPAILHLCNASANVPCTGTD